MIIKPILFNTLMVRAILNGRKTVTRRVIQGNIVYKCDIDHDGTLLDYEDCYGDFIAPEKLCRYQPGDILYVRESFGQIARHIFWYKATPPKGCENLLWKPSIFMPKEAARIWLKVTDVRSDRLQNMERIDFLNEGLRLPEDEQHVDLLLKAEFKGLWNSTVKKQDLGKYGWDANPYVWVIDFEQCKKPEI